jgi:ATP-binding cassette, subfamily B, bacterial
MDKLRLILRLDSTLFKLSPNAVILYVLLSFISQTAIPLAIPVFLGNMTNGFAHGGSLSSYLGWLLLTLVFVPLNVWFRLAQTNMDNRMETSIRTRVFDKVICQTPEFFSKYNPEELTNVLTQTTTEAQQAIRSLTVDPLLQFASLAFATVLIVEELRTMNGHLVWPMVLLMVVFGVVSVTLVQVKGQKPIYEVQRDFQQERFALAGLTDSAVKSPEEIQAMDAEPIFSERYTAGLEKLMNLKKRQVFTMEMINTALGFPTQAILAALYGFIVYQAISGRNTIEPGVFIALAGLTPQLMAPFRTFATIGIVASSSWPAIEIVNKLLEQENRIRDLPGSKQVENLEPTLESKDVEFQYQPQLRKIFDGLNFSVPPSKITTLCARMGQGKTSFFRLALRFYDPDQGQILLGGIPTTVFTLQSLRQRAVMMSQFPAFFHDTVRDNLRIAKHDATDEEIQALCESTGVWPILERTLGKNPLDSPFAAGIGLSGGEKRLFALTRCLLRSPTFLFLDELTSNMSNDEKYVLIPMMRAACAGRTVVVVDHDIPWLIRFSDHIVVLDNGKIVQQGTPEQLLEEPGLFKELYTLSCIDPALNAAVHAATAVNPSAH